MSISAVATGSNADDLPSAIGPSIREQRLIIADYNAWEEKNRQPRLHDPELCGLEPELSCPDCLVAFLAKPEMTSEELLAHDAKLRQKQADEAERLLQEEERLRQAESIRCLVLAMRPALADVVREVLAEDLPEAIQAILGIGVTCGSN
jgi:hypothetical protein